MKVIAGIVSMLVLASGLAWADSESQEDPVLNLLVKKGLVTQQDADTAKAEERQLAESKPPASNIFLKDNSVQKLEFYGDGRLRFENIDQHNEYGTNTLYDRERYRLRVGADYSYSDHFKAGFELESGTADDSANQTLGGSFTKSSINVGRIFLQWQPVDELTLIGGKFANPWYTTTDLVYSFDLNPEGGAELFSYTIPLGHGSGVVDNRDPKEVKSLAQAADDGPTLTVGLNAVQYLYVDSNEGNLGLNNNDVFIIGEQIPVTWKVNKDLTAKVAPGFTFYTGGGNVDYDGGVATNSNIPSPTSTGTPSGTTGPVAVFYGGTANSAVDPVFYSPREADDLAVFSAPGEFNFKVDGVPFRPYWDFEYNTEAHQRVQNVYLNTSTFDSYGTGVSAAAAAQNKNLTDGIAWAAGLQIGANKKKGDWSLLGEYRQIGLGAVDQNINGTDFADSYANQQGFKLAGAYNFTDFFTGTVTFYDTWAYKRNLYHALGGPSTLSSTTAPYESSTLNLVGEKASQRVQVDLGWKF